MKFGINIMHSLLKECFLLNVSEMLSIQNNGFIWNLIKLLVSAWYKLFITYTTWRSVSLYVVK